MRYDTSSQIQELLTTHEGTHQSELKQAVAQQHRIKFFADPTFVDTTAGMVELNNFKAFVRGLLPLEKYKTFETLLRMPLKSVAVVDTVFDRLSRIFQGRNAVYNYEFMEREYNDDWEWYRQEHLNEPMVWQTKAWDVFKTGINSVIIVDVADETKGETELAGELPAPYFFFLDIANVVGYGLEDDNISWIAFKQEEEKLAFFDKYSYRVFDYEDGLVGALLRESPHSLGYCPARFFWGEKGASNETVRLSPLTEVLSDLEWFCYYTTAKKHLDHSGAYPIYSMYEPECDYQSEEGEDSLKRPVECSGGFLKFVTGGFLKSGNELQPCPKCAKKRMAGPGSLIKVPIPKEGEPDLRNPVQMLTADVASLDYAVREEDRLKRNIIITTTGGDLTDQNDEAKNEMQVQSSFEGQNAVLFEVKKGFENAQMWTSKTCCLLRVGKDNFISVNINYGTEFFDKKVSDLWEEYAQAKANGASEAQLESINSQIQQTANRNKPSEMQRVQILQEVEPLPLYTRIEAQDMYKVGFITREELLIKLRFTEYIRRFERENGNVTEVFLAMPFAEKIEAIRAVLATYVSQQEESSKQTEEIINNN